MEQYQSNWPETLERIKLKRARLAGYWEHGVPSGAYYPTSMAKARVWEDLDDMIFPVGSKRDFSTKHPKFGGELRVVQSLINLICGRERELIKKSKSRASKDTRIANLTEENTALKVLASNAQSQWHTARRDADKSISDAKSDAARAKYFQEKLREKEAENDQLRRMIIRPIT